MTTPQTLPDEAARRRVREELDTTFLVEAGAGTGKTRLLVDRVERLVTSGRVRLRNVVAITFTEKAAAELRVQIRQRIEASLRGAGGEDRARLRQALADLEIAPVSTIHAFAADLLRERPVEAGVDPAFAVADELTASLFRTEAWDRWLEQQKDLAPEPLRDAIESGISLGQMRATGDVLLRFRDVFERDLDRGQRPQDPLAWLRALELELRGTVARTATDCLNQEDRGAADLRALGQTLDVLGQLAESEARRTVLAGALKLKIGGNQARWRAGVLKRIKERMAELQGELDGLREAWGDWLATGAVNWLRGYVAEYQRLKGREGALDFDDLLLLARNLLRDNLDVRADLQKGFQAILVDEFQDTDPLQTEIIFYLAEDGAEARVWTDVRLRPGKLFIVGDPKQSIYAFRRADIETYELAKRVLSRSGDVEHITANFRSMQEILTAVNATFAGQMRSPADGMYQPDYVALTESTKTRTSPDAHPLMLLYPDSSDGDANDTMGAYRAREAEMIAAALRHYIDTGLWKVGEERRPAGFGHVALLFRGMADVPVYEEALKRYDIPYRVTSSRTFYKREEVGWLVNVLHAVEHPTDAVAVWGALRSSFCGCSDRDIYDLVAVGGSFDYRLPLPAAVPQGVEAAYGILRRCHEERNRWHVARMVEEVLARTNALGTFLLTPQGEQRVANLQKVVTLARALQDSGILTFRAFVHWLRDMEEQALDEAESPTVEEGDDVVRIMSIHAAKGLEFLIVVIPDLARRAGGSTEPVLLHRVRGEAGVYVGKTGSWAIQTANYESLKAEHERREAAERLRVLYVAMTRAKDALVLPVFPVRPAGTLIADLTPVLPSVPRFGTLSNGWLMVSDGSIAKISADPPAVRLAVSTEPTPEGEAVAAQRAAWFAARSEVMATAGKTAHIITPSTLVDHERLRALQGRTGALEVERGGQLLGTLVHEVLAAIPLDRPDLAEDYTKYFAAKRGKSGSIVKRGAALVATALQSEVVRSALAGRCWREVPFVKATPEGIVEGAMDFVVEDKAGRMAVVDFKTDVASTELIQELEAIYAPQLKSYAAVLKQAVPGEVSSKLLFLRSLPQTSG